MSDFIEKVKCPFCQQKYLGEAQEFTEFASDKSWTGSFIIPADLPIVVCQACGAKFKWIKCDTKNNYEVVDFKVLELPERQLRP